MAEKSEITTTNEDLGLGAKVIQENRSRFLNKDGSFNVHRKGMFERGAFSPYHATLNMSWTRFYAYMVVAYLFANFIFTGLYLLAGHAAFPDIANFDFAGRFGEIFYFSIQAITTLGSSPIHPATVFAKTIFALEAFTGLLSFAVGAGFIFARISNPAVKIIFSESAIIAPYNGGEAFMFRLINGRSNELIDLSATVTLAMIDKNGKRSFHQLPLERSSVLVFPLSWTVVHPIEKGSQLFGMTTADLERAHAEFIITIVAMDQDLAKTVYVRHSYLYDEIVVGAKFTNIFEHTSDGTVVVDPKRIHEIEEVALPKPR
jgi:inward rectifier potassium channel